MHEIKIANTKIVWADGDTQSAIEIHVEPMSGIDIDAAAELLGCAPGAVNHCSPSEMTAYGVSLKTDIFQRPSGLAR